MPRFDEDAFIATKAIDEVFAEDFVLRPYMQPANKTARDTPDPSRDTVRLCGVWRDKIADPREPNAYDQREYRRPGTTSDVPTVEFAYSAYACFTRFEVRDGDQIERCATGGVYRAKAPTVTPNGTVRVPVNRLGRP